MNGNKFNSSPIAIRIIGFIFILTIGGITGIILSDSIIDIHLHDSSKEQN